MVKDENTINHLRYLLKTYDTIVDTMKVTDQRLQSIMPDADLSLMPEYNNFKTAKGNVSRRIEKELSSWPLYTDWLANVPGIGPFIAGNLVMLYYYAFDPICESCGGSLEKQEDEDGKKTLVCIECGKKSKGEGLLKHKIRFKQFDNVSKWWKYMGRHIDPIEGKMPKRKKGVVCDWSNLGRVVTYQVGDQFNRQKADHPYKAYMLEEKKRYEKNKPDWSKGHIHNAAKQNTIQLFLSHMWHVAREIEGLSTDGPYAQVILGHTGIIAPYYWKEDITK